MKIHSRSTMVEDAEQKIRTAMHEATSELTLTERLQVVHRVASDYIAGILKYSIRQERHGDTEKPGDLI